MIGNTGRAKPQRIGDAMSFLAICSQILPYLYQRIQETSMVTN